jgi:adenylate kinase family enzyme
MHLFADLIEHILSNLMFCFPATDLILQNMEQQTEMGVRCMEILTRGEAVPEEMVFEMINEKINSPEVAHNGKSK